MTGHFAKSLSGHDKDRVYIIIEETEKDYLVADGTYRTLDNPKKKNKKHVQIIKKDNSFSNNEDIKRLVKAYKEEMGCQKPM